MNNFNWSFDEPKNLAVFTTAEVIHNNEPILYVSHEEEDEAWQFFPYKNILINHVMLVALHRIINLDESLMALSDLPLGWIAERESINDTWIRSKKTD